MELLTTSLERFYKRVGLKEQLIPEPVLGKIAVCVSISLQRQISGIWRHSTIPVGYVRGVTSPVSDIFSKLGSCWL